ncbi:MAG: AAA family ATPase [Thermoplasmata archaeon]|nr:AAA family ATPase [Thermoplasmata archaeon]MCI4354861.1 AAA family ATPase [Thermoplasmata archaeon]
MIDRVVTITGPPGSGKSTAGRGLAERLGLEFRSAGELFRANARDRGLSLADFSRLAEADESIDRSLDDAMLRLATPGRVLEGRITGALCRRRGIRCYYLHVTARPDVRYRRLAQRDHLDVAGATAATPLREASERDRYVRFYGIDLDREPADLSVDSSDLPAEAVIDRLAGFVRAQISPEHA